jgi:glycosyltransferase involved in cell wall biosynthesis
MKSAANRFIKKIFLQLFLFRFARFLLYIGQQNKRFYEYYGVPSRKLAFAPYAVDNERFQAAAASTSRDEVRSKNKIPRDAFVILFVAKLIEKKRPMDLLKAFALLQIKNKCLVMVGEGELRNEIETYIRDNNPGNVILPGFKNQSEIPSWYKSADVFVLCSGVGETWGLSVNEAMNFDLPVVVSRTSGCSGDLVGRESGATFETASIAGLAAAITECYSKLGSYKPTKVVDNYSFEKIKATLLAIG